MTENKAYTIAWYGAEGCCDGAANLRYRINNAGAYNPINNLGNEVKKAPQCKTYESRKLVGSVDFRNG